MKENNERNANTNKRFNASQSINRADRSGILTNPIIWADIPDPDVICVDDVYYMTSTTMYFTPGVPIMKSYDLVNWELIGYVYDILDDSDTNALRNGANAYGKGSWASCIRYHKGTFYVVTAALNTQKTYIYQTTDIENGEWQCSVLDGFYHDSSLLFDDDGRVYLIYGGGAIRIIELTEDVTAIKEGGLDKVIIENANAIFKGSEDKGLPGEGAHFYKIDGMYYIFLISWPACGNHRRVEICYRSDKVDGPYEGRVVLDDDMGDNNRGVAQGGLVKHNEKASYAMLFQDHGAVGRFPVLVPVSWEDGWPVFGVDGKVPRQVQGIQGVRGKEDIGDSSVNTGSKTDAGNTAGGAKGSSIVCSDEFDTQTLALPWQFNHNPDNSLWSLTERPGYLRLKTGYISKNLPDARNTLTQRTFGPVCSATVALETGAMKDGDTAGLAALQDKHAYAGVSAINGERYIVMVNSETNDAADIKGETGSEKSVSHVTVPDTDLPAGTVKYIPLTQDRIYLRVDFNFDKGNCICPDNNNDNGNGNNDKQNGSNDRKADTACFYYSLDGKTWTGIGNTLHMEYRLSHFTGYRFALFNFATKITGGHADFDYFRLSDELQQ